jgi:hypothetical protein
MRMESKNLDESIAMANFDYAMPKASSLDIDNTSTADAPLTKSGFGAYCRRHEHQGRYHKQVA